MESNHDFAKLILGGATVLLTCAGLASAIRIMNLQNEVSDYKASIKIIEHDLNNIIVDAYKQSDDYKHKTQLYTEIAKDATRPTNERKEAIQNLINYNDSNFILSHKDELNIQLSPIYDKSKIDALNANKDKFQKLYNSHNGVLTFTERLAVLSTLGATITGTYATSFVNQDMADSCTEDEEDVWI